MKGIKPGKRALLDVLFVALLFAASFLGQQMGLLLGGDLVVRAFFAAILCTPVFLVYMRNR